MGPGGTGAGPGPLHRKVQFSGQVRSGPQRHVGGLPVRLLPAGNRLDDDDDVQHPYVEQDFPLGEICTVPGCREVACLVQDISEMIPPARVGTRLLLDLRDLGFSRHHLLPEPVQLLLYDLPLLGGEVQLEEEREVWGRERSMDEAGWEAFSRGSPLRHAGRVGFLRNVAIALGNWASREAVRVLTAALSDAESLVRGHAVWALGETRSAESVAAVETLLPTEQDPFVRDELAAAPLRLR